MHTALAPEIGRVQAAPRIARVRLHLVLACLGLALLAGSSTLLIDRYFRLHAAADHLVDLITLRAHLFDATLQAQIDWISQRNEVIAHKNALALALANGRMTKPEHDSLLANVDNRLSELDDQKTRFTDLAAHNANLAPQEKPAREYYHRQLTRFRLFLIVLLPLALFGAAAFAISTALWFQRRRTTPVPEPFNPHHQPLPHARSRHA